MYTAFLGYLNNNTLLSHVTQLPVVLLTHALIAKSNLAVVSTWRVSKTWNKPERNIFYAYFYLGNQLHVYISKILVRISKVMYSLNIMIHGNSVGVCTGILIVSVNSFPKCMCCYHESLCSDTMPALPYCMWGISSCLAHLGVGSCWHHTDHSSHESEKVCVFDLHTSFQFDSQKSMQCYLHSVK